MVTGSIHLLLLFSDLFSLSKLNMLKTKEIVLVTIGQNLPNLEITQK